jgi:hypothetical protein
MIPHQRVGLRASPTGSLPASEESRWTPCVAARMAVCFGLLANLKRLAGGSLSQRNNPGVLGGGELSSELRRLGR